MQHCTETLHLQTNALKDVTKRNSNASTKHCSDSVRKRRFCLMDGIGVLNSVYSNANKIICHVRKQSKAEATKLCSATILA